MKRSIEFLDPARKLVDEVVDWLCGGARQAGRVREAEGAKSLAHVLVVVPTAQSGRSLRLALARAAAQRGWGGLLPPQVALPMQLVRSADASLPLATPAALRAAFVRFIAETPSLAAYPHLFLAQRADGSAYELARDFPAQLAFFDQLQDIWRILAGGGLMMADVPAHPRAAACLQAALGDEAARWEELAQFERAFLARLHAWGLRHPAEDVKRARTDPRPLPEEVEEVALPVLADPVSVLYDVLERTAPHVTVLLHARPDEAARFDAWGRADGEAWRSGALPPDALLRDADIVCAATDEDLARRVAADFPPAGETRLRPALGLCDAALFPELSAAFLNRGYVLHNPERHRLTVSSLGRMLAHLLDLYAARRERLPWAPFAALLREDDVLAALADGPDAPGRVPVLVGLDVCQNRFLPTALPTDLAYDVREVHPRSRAAFEAFLAAGRALLKILEDAWRDDAPPAAFLRRALGALFAHRALLGTEAEKEFRAATDAVREVLDAFDAPEAVSAPLAEGAQTGLLRKALSEAAYALEPTERNAVNTEGWLELVWSAADHIALAGFTEGAVPDSVVGHPFVPDDLRAALGLTSNATRMARDAMLLADIVRARAPGAVRAHLALTNAAGDQRRPSRLLFRVPSEALARRVRRLFGDVPANGVRTARALEPLWRPNLPLAPTGGEHLSASAIDTWLHCPFTYLLQYGMGMRRYEEKEELEANDFGLLIHGVLEDYAREQIARAADGCAQLADEGDIARAFARLLAARRQKFGERLALNLRLQFDAAEGRLLAFAPLQAHWAGAGWRIVETPEYKFRDVRPFAGEADVDVPFTGSIDRIDFKEGVGYRLIDYKTWDKTEDAKGHVVRGGALQHEHARRLHLPELETVAKTSQKSSFSRFLSVQLLLYAACLECADEKFRGQIADCCYVILGCDAANAGAFGSVCDQGAFGVGARFPLLDHRALALETVRAAIRRIRGNIFWPPGPTEDWKYDFKELFLLSPEGDLPVGTPWRDAQEARLAGLEGTR